VTIVNDTIVQASFTIITYDRKNIFIIQATVFRISELKFSKTKQGGESLVIKANQPY
jgi:hypothetical protein